MERLHRRVHARTLEALDTERAAHEATKAELQIARAMQHAYALDKKEAEVELQAMREALESKAVETFSQIKNCHLIPNPLYDCLVSDEGFAAGKRVAIIIHADGRCTVDLEGFLIAPLGLFTKRHLRLIEKLMDDQALTRKDA